MTDTVARVWSEDDGSPKVPSTAEEFQAFRDSITRNLLEAIQPEINQLRARIGDLESALALHTNSGVVHGRREG